MGGAWVKAAAGSGSDAGVRRHPRGRPVNRHGARVAPRARAQSRFLTGVMLSVIPTASWG
jgi:hypothetical protein